MKRALRSRLEGMGNIKANSWYGRRRRDRQLICRGCGKTFSENHDTSFYGLMTDKETEMRALISVAFLALPLSS